MQETTVTLMGIPINISYEIYQNVYIEWCLVRTNEPEADIHRLLDLLLRVNHSTWIEAVIREHEHYDSMAKATGFSPDSPEEFFRTSPIPYSF